MAVTSRCADAGGLGSSGRGRGQGERELGEGSRSGKQVGNLRKMLLFVAAQCAQAAGMYAIFAAVPQTRALLDVLAYPNSHLKHVLRHTYA